MSEQIPSPDTLRTALETADRLHVLATGFFISVEGRKFPWGLTRGADCALSENLATLRRVMLDWVAQRKPPDHVVGWPRALEVESALFGLWCIENAITKRVYPKVYGEDPDWQPVPYAMTIPELECIERARAWLREALHGEAAQGELDGQSTKDAVTEARDKFMYEEAFKGTVYKAIASRVSQKQEWGSIGESGVRNRVKAYAKRHGLSQPTVRKQPRKADRSRSQ
jgi:hypothetical protein